MTKEDKQIIDRATKENWRTGDRTRLKRLLEKNLKLYRENVELKERYDKVDIIGYDALKNLTKAKEIIEKLLNAFASNDFFEEEELSAMAEAEQFLKDENIILEDAQARNSPFDADEVFNKEMKAYPDEKIK